jgi:outer membrane receptor protein involved in Fe transport
LDCNSPLFAPQANLGGRAYVELAAPCGPTTTLSSIGPNSTINYFAGTDQVNSGQLSTAGIDMSASYRFDGVAGGTLTPSIDVSYTLDYTLGDFTIDGLLFAPGYDGVGFKNNTTNGRLGIAVPEWRGSAGLNYKVGRHTLNILATFIPSIRNEDASDFDASNDQNANVGNANGVVTTGTTTGTAACTVPGIAPTGITTGIGSTPAGAGTGQFGTASVLQTGAGSTSTRGFCGTQNAAVLSGTEIKSNTNIDLTYRVQLTDGLALSLTVYNLLDQAPSFDRSTTGYNPGFGSPLERNFKVGVQAKF